MDRKFARFKQFSLVGSLSSTGATPIADGSQFNTTPFPIGEGNRCKLGLFVFPPGNPYGTMTSCELYLTWYGSAQRFATGGSSLVFGPSFNTRWDNVEAIDAAGASPDQRVHELKYYTFKLPLTTPPIPFPPGPGGQAAPNFQWDFVAPMDSFIAYLKTSPAGPFPGIMQLHAAAGANAE